MTDNHLDDFDRRLRERITRHKTERTQASRELFGEATDAPGPSPDLSGLPFDEAIAAYDDWMERRIRTWRGEKVPPVSPTQDMPKPTPPEPEWRGRVKPVRQLEDMDALMVSSFALNEFLPTCVADMPSLIACRTLDDFTMPLKPLLPDYRNEFARWTKLVRQGQGRVQHGNPFSRLALHLPRCPTYINGWQLVGGQGTDLSAALQDHKVLRRAVNAVAAERWGYGFVEQYTAWGQDLRAMNLDTFHLTHRLGLPSPPASPHTAQGAAMAEGALLTTTGWALWVGKYLAQRARPAAKPGLPEQEQKFTLSQLWDAFKRLFRVVPLETWAEIFKVPLPGIDQLVKAVSETLSWLLINTDLEGKMINRSVRRAQRMILTLEPQFRRSAGVSLRQSLARMLFNNAEAHLGVMPIPYAVLMAANLDFNPRWDAAEIRRWLDGSARQNVDARMVMLTRLDRSVKHNVSTLVSAAVHSLGLRPPDGLEWT